MKNPFINNNDLTEIVFENRHKEYGAYQLRARYDKTMRKSLFVSVGTLVVLGLSALVFSSKADEAPDVITIVTDLTDGEKIMIVPDEPEKLETPKKAEELPPISTVKDTEMRIVEDNKVTEKDVVQTRDEMKDKVGVAKQLKIRMEILMLNHCQLQIIIAMVMEDRKELLKERPTRNLLV